MASYTFRSDRTYRFEITFGSFQCLISNATIEKQMQGLGFDDVSVSGSGRNRITERSWFHDDAKIKITSIGRAKFKFQLAEILE